MNYKIADLCKTIIIDTQSSSGADVPKVAAIDVERVSEFSKSAC
jgi:hypothetical protein